jgi:hypothetical protein
MGAPSEPVGLGSVLPLLDEVCDKLRDPMGLVKVNELRLLPLMMALPMPFDAEDVVDVVDAGLLDAEERGGNSLVFTRMLLFDSRLISLLRGG